METSAKAEIRRIEARKADPIQLDFKQRTRNCFRFHWKGLVTPFVFLVYIPIIFASQEHIKAMVCSYMLLVMTTLFIFELLPFGMIAALPLIVCPLSGILSADKISSSYMTSPAFLFLSSIWVATAMVYSKVNQRIGLLICKKIGFNLKLLLAFIMLVTFTFSFILNQAFICVLMYPIIDAIMMELEAQGISPAYEEPSQIFIDDEPPRPTRVGRAFFLGVSYASLIGGSCTWFGSTLVRDFSDIYHKVDEDANRIEHLYRLLAFNILIALILFVVVYIWLLGVFIIFKRKRPAEGEQKPPTAGPEKLQERIDQLGKITGHEVGVLAFISITCLLMLSRQPEFFPGWGPVLEKKVADEQPVVLSVLLMNLFPTTCSCFLYWITKRPNQERTSPAFLAPKPLFSVTPWASFFIAAGGAGVAATIQASGLLELFTYALKDNIGNSAQALNIALLGIIVFGSVSFAVPLSHVMLPAIMKSAVGSKMSPGYLGVPSLTMLGYTFIFPISSPATCIAHCWANIKMLDMLLAGLPLTVFALMITKLCGMTWLFVAWPDWTK